MNAGQVRELTDEIDTSNYLDAALSPLVFDDKVYGAPLGIKIVPVWYNKDIFRSMVSESRKLTRSCCPSLIH